MNGDHPVPEAARTFLNVLFVFDNLELSGADKVALDFIRLTADDFRHGVKARGFVCMADKTGQACKGDDLAFAMPGLDPATPIWKKPFLGLRAILLCIRAARSANLLVGVTPPAAFVAACAGAIAGKPVAAWVHYDIKGWARELDAYSRGLIARFFEIFFYRHFVPRFNNLVFASDATLEAMAGPRKTRPARWISIPYPFSERAFARDTPDLSSLSKLKTEGAPTLVLLGRLTRQKRWGDAIRALELVTLPGPAPHLIVIGDGDQRDEFVACAAASPAAKRIHWLGSLRNPGPVLAVCDALLLTSLYEAWPVVILEAFKARVPVLAYDCPSGPSEMLADGRGLCCREDPAAMARAIEELLAMPIASRKTMTDLAADYLTRHDNDRVVAQWAAYARSIAATS